MAGPPQRPYRHWIVVGNANPFNIQPPGFYYVSPDFFTMKVEMGVKKGQSLTRDTDIATNLVPSFMTIMPFMIFFMFIALLLGPGIGYGKHRHVDI